MIKEGLFLKNSFRYKRDASHWFDAFALFFGAGNDFPPVLGQYAGENVWLAIGGFCSQE
ncbi:branched-chain amino acid transport system II carrier protein [Bacillus sp. SL00103]